MEIYMKLIFDAFSVYCLSLYYELYRKVFDGRISRRLRHSQELTDSVTVSLSNICWHYRLKLKIAEAEFELRLAQASDSSAR